MKKRALFSLLAVLLITSVFALPIANSKYTDRDKDISDSSDVSKASNIIVKPPQKQEQKPKETIAKNDQKVVFIVELTGEPLIDTVINSNGKYRNIPELVLTNEGKVCCDTIRKNQAIIKASIQKLIKDYDFSDSRVYCALINGFSVKAPMSAREKIEKINGVKSVMISDSVLYSQDISEYPASIRDISEQELALLNYNSELDGSNTLIAVIDSEFNVSHEAFSVEPSVRKYNSSDVDNIFKAVSFSVSGKYKPENIVKNNKIIYSYDYYENDTDTYDMNLCHGTHIAALIGGNNGRDDENAFHGIAYDSQLALMKVSGGNMSANSHAVLSALDDCAKLDVDVINISMAMDGTDDIFKKPFEKLINTGTVIISPCGNDESEKELETYDIDHGKLNVLCRDTFSVASSANDKIKADYISINGNYFYYSDIYSENHDLIFRDISQDENEYIYLSPDESGKFDYSQTQDKIVIVERDGYDWEEHARQAFFAGAKAMAVIDSGDFQDNAYNNISTVEKEYIPMIFLDDGYTGYFEAYPQGIFGIGQDSVLIDSDNGNTMSKYSSWGVTDDLKLKPEITSVGENVLSADSDGEYGYMSGTSVSTALVSGSYAVVKQYLSGYEWFNSMSLAEQSETIISVIMCNAEPVKTYSYEDDELLYISPRKQGAGRVDIASVTASGAYLEVTDSKTPVANIGDGTDGKYKFSFKIKNISSEHQTFSAEYFIQTDKPELSDDKRINTLEPYSLRDIAEISLKHNGEIFEEIAVEPFGEFELDAEIEIDSEKADEFMKAYFPDGFYIDGFIVLENAAGRTLNLPFMGFFGEWGSIDPFYPANEGNRMSFVAADYNAVAEPVVLKDDISVSKNTVGNYYSVSNLKNAYIIPHIDVIRDCFDFTVTVSDKNNKQLFSKNYGHITKDKTIYEQISNDSSEIAEFFSNLADGDYIYTVSAKTMTSNGSLSENIYSSQCGFSVDSQKPQVISSETYQSDENIYLRLTARDDRYVNGFEFYTAAYNNKTKKYDYADRLDDLILGSFISSDALFIDERIENADGSVSYIYDITSLYSELMKLQFITRTNISPFSALKIAYRAYDGAYNFTEIKIADAVAYKKAVFELIDQNNKPVKDVMMSLGNRTAYSDENGIIIFDSLLPDVYLAEILFVPEYYSVNEKYFLISISDDDSIQKIEFDFSGEYPEVIQQSSDVSEELSETSPESYLDENSEINSFYALLFVGLLLLVSSVSLAVSRKRRN